MVIDETRTQIKRSISLRRALIYVCVWWLSTWSLKFSLTVISMWDRERDFEVNASEFNCQDTQFAIALKNQMIISFRLYAMQNGVDTYLNNEQKMRSAEEFKLRLLIENIRLWVVTTSIKINLKRRVKLGDKCRLPIIVLRIAKTHYAKYTRRLCCAWISLLLMQLHIVRARHRRNAWSCGQHTRKN